MQQRRKDCVGENSFCSGSDGSGTQSSTEGTPIRPIVWLTVEYLTVSCRRQETGERYRCIQIAQSEQNFIACFDRLRCKVRSNVLGVNWCNLSSTGSVRKVSFGGRDNAPMIFRIYTSRIYRRESVLLLKDCQRWRCWRRRYLYRRYE